jgi:hypothetical protein
MRRGDPLVQAVNDILKRLKSTGTLTGMFKTTARDYEQITGFNPDALADAILPPQACVQ